ncbi:unnamed protein product [Clonostachys byssicola]|uniref:Uncharacterized protein n=1 Tax=Clonostachys byssicola TaxID=160290 RepID=A0A9N9XZQ4_9HYPO|nr:unnamed protein product [Clonostachys byssicola]
MVPAISSVQSGGQEKVQNLVSGRLHHAGKLDRKLDCVEPFALVAIINPFVVLYNHYLENRDSHDAWNAFYFRVIHSFSLDAFVFLERAVKHFDLDPHRQHDPNAVGLYLCIIKCNPQLERYLHQRCFHKHPFHQLFLNGDYSDTNAERPPCIVSPAGLYFYFRPRRSVPLHGGFGLLERQPGV